MDMNTAETYIQSAGLDGIPVRERITIIKSETAAHTVIRKIDKTPSFICMPGGRCVQIDNFVDLDEAEKILHGILKRHFAIFGYSNSKLLFGAAEQELSMFLNDNDCAAEEDVYAIAKSIVGKNYKFCYPHIFERNANYPLSLRGLMIRLADKNGGVLNVNDAKSYLKKILLNCGSFNQLLQINESDVFLIYDDENYLLGKAIGIDAAWCRHMHEKLDNLFRMADVAYIIPRDIKSSWLETLPPLPHALPWTPLLLQEVLDKCPAIGFKTISSNQIRKSYQRLAAAFVPVNSPLTSLADVVSLFVKENHQLPMRLPAEKLRKELRAAGMLSNNELRFSLPKVLDDYRFSWSNDCKSVRIRATF